MSEEKRRKNVITGRGGSGKSTFTVLVSRVLNDLDWNPLLLVDSDPDESLNDMLGIDMKKEGVKTVSEVLYNIIKDQTMNESRATASEKIEPLLYQNALYKEREAFDFISLGPKWAAGCYCIADRVLGNIIENWAENYEYVIVDSPAGVEHLNRKITKEVNDVFNILDPSKKSFDNAKRSHRIMKEVGIEFKDYYLVAGYLFPESLEEETEEQEFEFLGRINYDEKVEKFNFEGRSLLDLPKSSPAYISTQKIMERAGYRRKPASLSELLNIE